jgi:hypothetical protein
MSTTTSTSGPAGPARQAPQATGWAGWLIFAAALMILLGGLPCVPGAHHPGQL